VATYFFEPGFAGSEKISGRLPAILPFSKESGGWGFILLDKFMKLLVFMMPSRGDLKQNQDLKYRKICLRR
jgi:hypothetical protein